MQLLLTGKKRVIDPETGKEFEGDWEEVRLGDIACIRKGEQLSKSIMIKGAKYPVLNGGINFSGYTDKWNISENTITISEGGNSCGYINFITEYFWSGGHCYSITELKCNKYFLFQLLKSVENKIMKLRVGSGLPNIQKKDLNRFRLTIPSIENEQKAIANILSKADEEVKFMEEELFQLKEQKKGLMQLLLTGIIRV